MSAQREAVCRAALEWLRTPYAHRQRVKGAGVDCAQFPLAVYAEAGVIPPTDVGPYAPQWHLHRSEEIYLAWVQRFATEVQAAQPGDFAVWRFGRTFSHGAIVLEPPKIIHAYIEAGGVTLDDMHRNAGLASRPVRFFSPWSA